MEHTKVRKKSTEYTKIRKIFGTEQILKYGTNKRRKYGIFFD